MSASDEGLVDLVGGEGLSRVVPEGSSVRHKRLPCASIPQSARAME